MGRRKPQGKIIDLKTRLSINPDKEPLTADKLKTFKGNEHLTDEEAQEKVFVIHSLTALLFEYFKEVGKNGLNIDNQEVNIECKSKAA